jgi:hypothetical protein
VKESVLISFKPLYQYLYNRPEENLETPAMIHDPEMESRKLLNVSQMLYHRSNLNVHCKLQRTFQHFQAPMGIIHLSKWRNGHIFYCIHKDVSSIWEASSMRTANSKK